MMHYKKGENEEKELQKEDVPFKDCLPKAHNDFLWMHVRGGTKVNNVLDYVKNALDKQEYRSVVWTGYGGGVVKTVSCAEILKRSYPFYQITRTCYTSAQEHWIPQMEGLEEIVVKRKIPCIHILLSLDALDESICGVQKPNTKTDFWFYEHQSVAGAKRRANNNNNNNRNDNAPSGSRNQQPQQQNQQRQNKKQKAKQRDHKNANPAKKDESSPEAAPVEKSENIALGT